MAKRPKTTTAGPTADYPVLTNLMHDGESYAPGDTITLDEETAAQLIRDDIVGDQLAAQPEAKPEDSKK